MRNSLAGRMLGATLASMILASGLTAQPAASPPAQLAELVKAFLAPDLANDWEGAEKLPGIKWAAQPTELQNCLPDGGCYARQGTAVIGGRNLTAMATGARTILRYVYLRNGSAAFGEPAVLDALKAVGVTAQLARCPAKAGAGGTNWYRLKGEALNSGVLSIQTSCNGRPCEGFVMSVGDELPQLQPAQVSLYSEQCAPGAARTVAAKPIDALADLIFGFVPPTGQPGYEWKALTGLPTGITWNGDAPKQWDLTTLYGDSNPMAMSGSVTLGGRPFSVLASGTATHAKVVYVEEQGTGHPRGEHVLGIVYQKGLAITLVKCGPAYSSSTNNWYQMTSNRTQTVMIRQTIQYDGNIVTDRYELRLDGSQGKADPRDRRPGVSGCQ